MDTRSFYSSGPFCPVFFSLSDDGLRAYTDRNPAPARPVGSLVNTIIHADDNRDFSRRFVCTDLLHSNRR